MINTRDKIIDSSTDLKSIPTAIKVLPGGNTTFFTPQQETSFLYKVHIKDKNDFAAKAYQRSDEFVNSLINERNTEIEFINTESKTLSQNLVLIDSDLPRIVSQALLINYLNKESSFSEIAHILKIENPLDYPSDPKWPYYKYRVKRMLKHMSMGMTAEIPWYGDLNIRDPLVVKHKGETIAYHIYDIQKYEEYLLNNTYLQTKPIQIFERDEEVFLKLNFQIQFSSNLTN